MASLPHNAETSQLVSAQLPSFEASLTNGEYPYQQAPLTFPSFPPTDFEAQFQEIPGQEAWRVPTIHQEQPNRLPSSSSPFEKLAAENCCIPMFPRYGESQHGFLDVGAAGSWNGKLSHLLAYANGMEGNPMSPLPHGYLPEGAYLAEMMGSNPSNVAARWVTSPFPHQLPLTGKQFDYNGRIMSPNVGLTVDPSKEGLAIQDMSLMGGQPPLCTLPVDTMYTDKTAKFAFFGKQADLASSAAELSQDAASQQPRDGGNLNTSANQPLLHRVPSGSGTPSSSTSNSPSAARNSQEVFNAVASTTKSDSNAGDHSNVALLQEPKYVSSKKTSLLPTLVEIDNSEGMAKQCTSLDESDESIGLDITSSCERDNGWETMHNTSYKKKRTKDRSKNSMVQLPDAKDSGGEEIKDKRHKAADVDVMEDDPEKKVEQSNESDESMHLPTKESSKPPEAAKMDYIHVRARRGQATDSHSLAERVHHVLYHGCQELHECNMNLTSCNLSQSLPDHHFRSRKG